MLYLPGACAIAYWIWSNRREAFLGGPVLGAAVGLADFFGGQLKWVFERVRPCRALTDAVKIEPSGCGGLFSFPSNHAANTAAIASFLQVLYPKSGWISWPIVALIGFARVYVGAHYVTDVLGGWVLGGVTGWRGRLGAPSMAEVQEEGGVGCHADRKSGSVIGHG